MCGCSSMVEPQPSKLKTRVRFPSPAFRPIGLAGRRRLFGAAAAELYLAAVAQLVERVLGKDEVMGPNPISSSFVGLSDKRSPSDRPIELETLDSEIIRLFQREGVKSDGQGSF